MRKPNNSLNQNTCVVLVIMKPLLIRVLGSLDDDDDDDNNDDDDDHINNNNINNKD